MKYASLKTLLDILEDRIENHRLADGEKSNLKQIRRELLEELPRVLREEESKSSGWGT